MVQEFHVLRCFSCQTFQVQQVKKAKKWSCKMCGEKQSVIKEFGRGTGADCRCHVQKLNAKRGEMELEQVTWSLREKDKEAGQSLGGGARIVGGHEVRRSDSEPAEESRWDKYLLNISQGGEEQGEEPEDTLHLSISRLHGEGNGRKRKRAACRADEGSLNKDVLHHHHTEGKLPASAISKSDTVQHTRISVGSSSNQSRRGFTRGTISTDYNQADPGLTRGTINTDRNQADPGWTRGTINTDYIQADPGLTRGTINTDRNQADPGLTRGTINTDYNQADPGFAIQTITKDYNKAMPGFTMTTSTTESNQTKPDVRNTGSDRVYRHNKPCSFGLSAAPPISRWTQFLPVSHPQEEEVEDDGDKEEEETHLVKNTESKPLDLLGSSATPCSVGNIREPGHTSEHPKALSTPILPPHHQPCPSLPVNSLFNTCDDFEDFNFDDMF